MNANDPTRPRPDEPNLERRSFFKKLIALAAGGALGSALGNTPEAEACATDPYLGEIMLFAGNFAPRGWAFCNGQILSIAQNQALFSLLGTNYGGNGVTTFALPDLRGRAPIHAGQGPGLANRVLGEVGGEEAHTLTVPEMPAHTHNANAHSGNGNSANPAGALPARDPSGVPHYATGADTTMGSDAIGSTGGSQPHNNMQPYLVINYCIALQGIFPPQP